METLAPPAKKQKPSLDAAVTSLRGVGERVREKLEKLAISTVQDLLFHLPLRYQDRTRVAPIGSLSGGEELVVQGEVLLSQLKPSKKRASLTAIISDGTGSFTIRFFYFNKAQKESFQRGRTIRCFGEVRRSNYTLEMVHPEYRFVDDDIIVSVNENLTPVYPTTEGLNQTSLRALSEQALALLGGNHNNQLELLPASLLDSLKLPSLAAALCLLHRPPPDVSLALLTEGKHPAQKRLAFEELLAHQLSVRQLKRRVQSFSAPMFARNNKYITQFLAQLPFTLTDAQIRVTSEIEQDLQKHIPMSRLVQGDVGSGKTVVAAVAALLALENGYQVAIMAPTEILAEQHFQNFSHWLKPLGIQVTWLSGKIKTKARRDTLQAIEHGDAQLIVGTHALFQDEVTFKKLGLIIIDEQHRFGVDQRLTLREKGRDAQQLPHQLIMTATPIPRTLAMTAYADLDISVIDALPKGRQAIDTVVLPDARRDQIVQRVHEACLAGRQAYWVCPLIEESELLECQAAENTALDLAAALPDLNIGLVHGRMKSAQKEQIMADFKAGKLHLLVATTVIEVGVDVPNASLMIIENAERLGLSQLHQLRGRVGRGSIKSSCVLLYHGTLSGYAKERLAVMRETGDGFKIAQKDLELRGPGELLGTRQTGVLRLKIADLARDQAMLPEVIKAAEWMLTEHPQTVPLLIRRWLHNGMRYGDV